MLTMTRTDRAELIETIHQPWRATVGECLDRWQKLEPYARSASYLVVIGDHAARRTLNAARMAELAAALPR